MANPEYLNRMKSENLPFARDAGNPLDETERRHLEVLGLNVESTADKVRAVAITARTKIREMGLDQETESAIFWALEETRDCMNPREFLIFLLSDKEFEEIEASRIKAYHEIK